MTTWRLESMWTRTLSTTISTSSGSNGGSSLAMPGLSHARRAGRPAGTPAARGRPRADDDAARHAGHEAPDMGEEGDAALGAGQPERAEPVDQLEDEPEAQDD